MSTDGVCCKASWDRECYPEKVQNVLLTHKWVAHQTVTKGPQLKSRPGWAGSEGLGRREGWVLDSDVGRRAAVSRCAGCALSHLRACVSCSGVCSPPAKPHGVALFECKIVLRGGGRRLCQEACLGPRTQGSRVERPGQDRWLGGALTSEVIHRAWTCVDSEEDSADGSAGVLQTTGRRVMFAEEKLTKARKGSHRSVCCVC